MAGILTAAVASTFGANADPYFEYTALLLPGNGTNGAQNNTFLDGSTNNFTITRNGNTTQGTFSPFSQTGWGNYFDGTGDYLSVPDNAALEFGSSNFTLEFWYYPVAEENLDALVTKGWPTVFAPFLIAQGSAGRISLYASTNGSSWDIASDVAFGTGIALNAWHHVVMTRSGNTLGLFVDGVRGNTVDVTAKSFQNNTYNLTIGASVTGSNAANTYISNLRMVVGSSVYDPTQTTLTVPTSPLTAITNTSLLTCQSNRFIDNSTNNFTITKNGETSVVAFSPFNPTLPWIASISGGSGYFDGSGDYLTAADNAIFDLGATDWTIELWAYFNSVSGEKGLISHFAAGTPTPNAGYALRLSTSNSPSGLRLVCSGSSDVILQAAWTPVVGAWYHIAAVRNSGTLYIYVNGQQIGSTSIAITIGNPSALFAVGTAQTVASSDFNGYISNVRLVKGTAVYTGNFTPPTAPITNAGSTSAASYPSTTNVNTSFASSATILLLNFTNAGIYDATSKNDLETVGNAQISNTTAKFGSTSMSFDGTGDWLLNQSPIPPTTFGSGDFSIEMWIYATTSGTQRWLFDGRIATPADGAYPAIYITSGNVLVYYVSAAARITGTTTITTNTWHFVQVIRTSGTTKMYLNGTQEGSNYTDSTVYLNPGVSRPIIGAATNLVQPFTGYIQDLRVTTGYARPTTTPTAAFPTL